MVPEGVISALLAQIKDLKMEINLKNDEVFKAAQTNRELSARIMELENSLGQYSQRVGSLLQVSSVYSWYIDIH